MVFVSLCLRGEASNHRRGRSQMTDTDNDAPHVGMYISILTVEAAIILLLWVLERLYGSR